MNKDISAADANESHIYEEHPDPSWARRSWISLDGTWKLRHKGREFDILVPFPIGSEASGVNLRDSGVFVYSRTFDRPDLSSDQRLILHVGACDYEARVEVNSVAVGKHAGGYASFSFDITQLCKPGVNRLEILASDSHSPFQVRGKQTFLRKPFLVWYSGISGIWQSVWLEVTDKFRLERAELRPDFGTASVIGNVGLSKDSLGEERSPSALPRDFSAIRMELEITGSDGEKTAIDAGQPDNLGVFRFTIPFSSIGPEYWSPEHPNLYGVRYRLFRDGREADRVESYFGLRSIGVDGDGLRINGKRVFLRMVLLQGYYPRGSYAPLDRAAAESDILAVKTLGYNGARVHEKVESPFFQYLCDKHGLLTSFEMPSFYLPSKKAFSAYEAELRELVARDFPHPSCVVRALFNETWGIWGVYGQNSKTRNFVLRMVSLVKILDPTRPVIDNSGWEHLQTDIVDLHHYLRSPALARELYARVRAGDKSVYSGLSARKVVAFYLFNQILTKTRALFIERGQGRKWKRRGLKYARDACPSGQDGAPLFLSEYGGFGWYAAENRGSVEENIEVYTRDILNAGIFCGYCYTQLYDVGSETNGLLGFDRAPKVDAERIRAINSIPPAKFS